MLNASVDELAAIRNREIGFVFQRFNLLLVLSSYLLVVFSIFVTRSGLVNSVHAFGESSISVPLLVFMLFLLLGSLGLLIWRWKSINSEWKFGSAFSRDALFLYTNIILMALVLTILATLYPALKAAGTDPVQVLRYE